MFKLPKYRIKTLVGNTSNCKQGIVTKIRDTQYGFMYIVSLSTGPDSGKDAGEEVWAEFEMVVGEGARNDNGTDVANHRYKQGYKK